jgi:heat shock protein HslJ
MRKPRSSRLRILVLAGAGLCLLLGACGPSSPGSDDSSVVGRWASDEPGDPHLEFGEDGTVTGSDGCNAISTKYEVDGDLVTIEKHISTLRACRGVDTWLRHAATLRIDGDEATVFNHSDEQIGTLQRTNGL